MKALFVQVLWSENDELHGREAEIMSVADFEPIAARVASYKTGSYDKTKINLFCDDGSSFGLRLDLNDKCTGVASWVRSIQHGIETQGLDNMPKECADFYREAAKIEV